MSASRVEEPVHEAPRRAASEPRVVLVVDADGVSRRFVELTLGRGGAFVVEAAKDAASALEILAAERIDVVVAEMDLPDTSGLRLLRRLAQEQRLRGVPFVFLSSDARPEARVAAYRAGADAYFGKPVASEELFACVESLVARRRRERDEARTRAYTLAGNLDTLTFPDLVSLVGMARRSGTLSMITAKSTGTVCFDEGAPVHALYGNLVGVEAFRAMVVEDGGTFEFSPGPCSVAVTERTIHETGNALLLDAARIFDESSTGLMERPVEASGPKVATVAPPTGLADALAPSSTLAAQFEMALREPFALGEPRLWSEDQLARWSGADTGGDRLHVHLVAEMTSGVSAMLALAGAPTERWVMDALSANRKAFGLTFFFRHERSVDVVLLDASDPLAFGDALRRTPSFSVVAPAAGDLMSIGTKGRVGLSSYLTRFAPPAVVGVGNASLDASLRRLGAYDGALRCASGVLGEEGCDLRSIILRGLRLWASSGATPKPARGAK